MSTAGRDTTEDNQTRPDPAAVWCGIPVYNNAATIHDIARRCREVMPHVVVVDDGSTDADLRQLLRDLDVTVIRHAVNRGKGVALRTAFEHARTQGGEYLISIDGDGQHYPEDAPRFLPLLSPDTIVIGYRDEVIGVMPHVSEFGRQFSDFWIGLETGHSVRDTQSGFRAYPVAAMAELSLRADHYHFEIEVVTLALWAGLRCAAVPVRVHYPSRAERVSSFHPLHDNVRIGLLHARLMLRQLLPVPHRRISMGASGRQRGRIEGLLRENRTPATLAVACGFSLLMGIVLWPVAPLVILYLALRFHLNKLLVLLCSAIAFMPLLPRWSAAIGHLVTQNDCRPGLEWFVGSHIVALAIAPPAALLVFITARLMRRGQSA